MDLVGVAQELHFRLKALELPSDLKNHIQQNVLPQLEPSQRSDVFDHGLTATMSRKLPAWAHIQLWHQISHVLPLIPPGHRDLFFRECLVPLLDAKPTPSAWQKIQKILPQIPEDGRKLFIREVVTQLLENNPSERAQNQHFDALSSVLAEIPYRKITPLFIQQGLSHLILQGAGPALWRRVLDVFPSIPPAHRTRFLRHVLPGIMRRPNWPNDVRTTIQSVSELLPLIHRRARGWFYSAGLPALLAAKPSAVRMAAEINAAKRHLEKYPGDYFYGKTVAENLGQLAAPNRVDLFNSRPDPHAFDAALAAFNRRNASNIELPLDNATLVQLHETGQIRRGPFVLDLAPNGHIQVSRRKFNRLRFRKTGSQLVPLVGPLAGYLIRRVSRKSFKAWKAAHSDPELKNHVEPILENDGQLHAYTHSGKMLVLTRHVGPSVLDFLREHPKHGDEVRRQQRWILKKLEKKGIEFSTEGGGHAHDQNFLVQLVNGKPNVRLIDFDQANLLRPKKDADSQ